MKYCYQKTWFGNNQFWSFVMNDDGSNMRVLMKDLTILKLGYTTKDACYSIREAIQRLKAKYGKDIKVIDYDHQT